MTAAANLDQYVEALFQLLPPGKYWRKQDRTTRLARLILGLSPELVLVHDRFLQLIDELDPRTADDLIENWKELVGIFISSKTRTEI